MSRETRMESTARVETAVLFGLVDGPYGPTHPLDELAGLAEAAEVGVADRLVQRRQRPVAGTYLGSGKVAELAALIQASDANVAIADTDLTPAQVRNLTRQLEIRVVDRSELIMDIFARRARTAQAMLQVELAQAKYALPRLRGQWTHLDRYVGGGVGTRGPGEKQIETDRRILRRRVRDLERRLKVFERRKQRTLAGRKESCKVALAGYTNTGKSTLFNALTGAGVPVADRLFATLDTRTRRWPIPDLDNVLLSDTVGFIRDLPHHLVASFHATLEEVIESDLVLHVVDATDPDVAHRRAVVRAVMKEIGADRVPTVTVVNKIDAVADSIDLQVLRNAEHDTVLVSALTGVGLEALAERVRTHFAGHKRRYLLRVPVQRGRALASVRRLADVLSSHTHGETVELTLEVEPRQVPRLRAWTQAEGLSLDPA